MSVLNHTVNNSAQMLGYFDDKGAHRQFISTQVNLTARSHRHGWDPLKTQMNNVLMKYLAMVSIPGRGPSFM